MGLVFHKVNKQVSSSKTHSAPKSSKQLTAQNIQFLKSIGLTPTTNHGYPQH